MTPLKCLQGKTYPKVGVLLQFQHPKDFDGHITIIYFLVFKKKSKSIADPERHRSRRESLGFQILLKIPKLQYSSSSQDPPIQKVL